MGTEIQGFGNLKWGRFRISKKTFDLTGSKSRFQESDEGGLVLENGHPISREIELALEIGICVTWSGFGRFPAYLWLPFVVKQASRQFTRRLVA